MNNDTLLALIDTHLTIATDLLLIAHQERHKTAPEWDAALANATDHAAGARDQIRTVLARPDPEAKAEALLGVAQSAHYIRQAWDNDEGPDRSTRNALRVALDELEAIDPSLARAWDGDEEEDGDEEDGDEEDGEDVASIAETEAIVQQVRHDLYTERIAPGGDLAARHATPRDEAGDA